MYFMYYLDIVCIFYMFTCFNASICVRYIQQGKIVCPTVSLEGKKWGIQFRFFDGHVECGTSTFLHMFIAENDFPNQWVFG